MSEQFVKETLRAATADLEPDTAGLTARSLSAYRARRRRRRAAGFGGAALVTAAAATAVAVAPSLTGPSRPSTAAVTSVEVVPAADSTASPAAAPEATLVKLSDLTGKCDQTALGSLTRYPITQPPSVAKDAPVTMGINGTLSCGPDGSWRLRTPEGKIEDIQTNGRTITLTPQAE